MLDTNLSLSDYSPEELIELVVGFGERPYRGKQLAFALKKGARNYNEVTSLSLDLREKLEAHRPMRSLEVVEVLKSKDGYTSKVLLRTLDGHFVETVWMEKPKTEKSKRRVTVCASSQIGCAFGCTFCATGRGGFVRDLRASEIFEQLICPFDLTPTHLVMMGMGEPFANYDNMWSAVSLINAGDSFNIGARRISISTLGVLDGIKRLSTEKFLPELAISLHAPNDELRRKLCPGAPSSIAELLAAADAYFEATGRIVMYEYMLVSGLNDLKEHALELAAKLAPRRAKVNLIPYNAVGVKGFKAPSRSEVEEFAELLASNGLYNTIRHERGADVQAACGQLRERRLAGE